MKSAFSRLPDRQSDMPRAWGALALSALVHGLAVVAMAGLCGPASCPPVMPRIVLTAALAPAGSGSGPAGPAPAAVEPASEPKPAQTPSEPEQPRLETLEAATPVPAPVVAPRQEPVTPKPAVKSKPVLPRPRSKAEPTPREVAAAAPASAPVDPDQTGAGGGSGSSSGPPLPSGGGVGPGSVGSPLSAGELDNQPAPVFSPKPEYPAQAKRRGLKGRLRVRLLVDRVGKVERVDILGGENVESFAESVRSTLSRWRFKPGTQKGTPVHWVAILPIAFEQE